MTGGYLSRTVITVDCRDLEPPEPMIQVLEKAAALTEKETLLMIHRKVPRLLFPRLDEMGLCHETAEEGEELVKLYIWREK